MEVCAVDSCCCHWCTAWLLLLLQAVPGFMCFVRRHTLLRRLVNALTDEMRQKHGSRPVAIKEFEPLMACQRYLPLSVYSAVSTGCLHSYQLLCSAQSGFCRQRFTQTGLLLVHAWQAAVLLWWGCW